MQDSIEKAAGLLIKSRHAIALTGAGISVESGIRPFRGPGGIWTEKGEPPMDGYQRFMADPRGHWERIVNKEEGADQFFASIGSAKPNAAHQALAELETLGVIKYLITQNIDNLHRAAGTKRLAEIHGNLFLLRCIICHKRYEIKEISLNILPPSCPACGGIIKTDTVMFGEPIPPDVLSVCQAQSQESDLMLCVGTSAVVYPAAAFPQMLKRNDGILIEIDPHETALTSICDISLRGAAGAVMKELATAVNKQLG